MPVGATLGAAGIGAVATIGGAAMGSSAQRRAASQAAATSSATNQANAALARENRAFGFNVLDPFRQPGIQATNALSGLLFGDQAMSGGSAPTSNALAETEAGYYGPSWEEIQGMEHDGIPGNAKAARGAYVPVSRAQPGMMVNPPTTPAVTAATDTAPVAGGTIPARTAWDQFREGTNYQFRLSEGQRALNLGMSNNGYSGSGAAVKEAIKYGQNFASNELGNYMQLLQGQQALGMGAASAMVGVGQNTTNALMAGNNANGTNQANAALAAGQANGQMWGGVAQGIGQIAGAVGSSYGVNRPQTSTSTFSGGGSFATPMFG